MKTNLKPIINWEIRTEPVLTPTNSDTKRKAIVRSDNNELLGIVGKDYSPVYNTQFMELTEALISTGEFIHKGYNEFNGGKTVLAFLENQNKDLKLNNCSVKEYLIIGNTHDGTQPFYIGTAANLIRCANQYFSTLKVLKKKHNSPLHIDHFSILNLIQNYKLKKSMVYDVFDGMEKVKVSESVVEQLIKEIHKMLATDSRSIAPSELGKSPSMITLRKSIEHEMKDLGNNAFGLFNGVTWYTSHEMRNAGADFGKVTGTANIINQKAYRFCANLKRKSNLYV